jgi:hypothetical protein
MFKWTLNPRCKKKIAFKIGQPRTSKCPYVNPTIKQTHKILHQAQKYQNCPTFHFKVKKESKNCTNPYLSDERADKYMVDPHKMSEVFVEILYCTGWKWKKSPSKTHQIGGSIQSTKIKTVIIRSAPFGF